MRCCVVQVSSPVPRPLTARGRHSQGEAGAGEEQTGGRSSVETLGRSSVDSALRRSFSSDLAGAGEELQLAGPGEEEELLASDSGGSRPGSRQM